ncbi:MAG: hypothetical protein V2I47_12050 [Bacteroidales bacterium]|nr:hypothetical protein [Bacteroidales bacterium]
MKITLKQAIATNKPVYRTLDIPHRSLACIRRINMDEALNDMIFAGYELYLNKVSDPWQTEIIVSLVESKGISFYIFYSGCVTCAFT